MTGFETPSGKNSATENFPVASLLLARELRPHVAAFYDFARAADDIADNPNLAPGEKIARLDRLDAALMGEATTDDGALKAFRLRESLLATGVPLIHGRELLIAFRQDALKTRYADWTELLQYCRYSANPVGRFLLDLHGEGPAPVAASDALCTALQIINHLQDSRDDYLQLDRVYVPTDWLKAEETDEAALADRCTGVALRLVFDRCLDRVAGLMEEARLLPLELADNRLALEAGAIVHLADRLVEVLRRRDPLAERVKMGRGRLIGHAGWGAARTALLRRWRGYQALPGTKPSR